MELSLIDRANKFEDLTNNNRKLINTHEDDNLRQSHIHNLDNGKYLSIGDANPMTQTILERVHGSGSVMTLRQNSLLNSSNTTSLRRNSSENNNMNGGNNLDVNMSRQRHQSNGEEDEDDDNESTSSESSSTKSSHTAPISSSSSSAVNKSSMAAVRAASSLFHDGKRHISRLMNRSFLRKTGKKTVQHHIHDIDEEEEDSERLLINDGSNGDLKYKASRNLKEPPQFDRTQLLQTIVNAHHGPIWCMRYEKQNSSIGCLF